MELRERILQVSTESFLTVGIRSVSMDDIAKKLAISKKTIYKFFKNKDEIVHEVTRSLVGNAECVCSVKMEGAKSAIDELLQLIDFINTFFVNMNGTAMYDLEKYYPNSYELFREHQNVFLYESLVKNLERGIEEGFYRKGLNVEIVARLRMGQIKLAFDQDIFPGNTFDLRKIQLTSLELYMMGIATEEGRKIIEKFKHEFDV